MTESSLTTKIKKHLESSGFLVFKLHGANYQSAGLPDLLAIKGGRAFWVEVKTESGKLTKLQEIMLERLRLAGCVAGVVRSVDEARDLLTLPRLARD